MSPSESWWSGVLVEIGVTIMLLVPLLLLTGLVERQMRGVREAQAEIEATQAQTSERIEQLVADVAETREQVSRTREELAETMKERLTRVAEAERAMVDALESNPSMTATRDALKRATELRLINDFGVCIPVGRSTFLRFLPVPTQTYPGAWSTGETWPDDVLVCRLGFGQELGGELLWSEKQTVEEFLESLAIRLRSVDNYPGDEKFSQQAPLVSLKRILSLALDENRSGSVSGLRGIIAFIPNGGWTFTAEGIYKIGGTKPAFIPWYRIGGMQSGSEEHRNELKAAFPPDTPAAMALYLYGTMRSLIRHEVIDPDAPPF